ncbi:unnamed protein product [Nyctereutes procyonoides]|uniref:(raccoon dog) hypothetical protein n=1 Tax=Nyctereutes procyonoides TaxID=34880 RepID=A0A811YWU2_NYCPR|nr:unnamed protein product [Nyctereutes procyonoides]
MQVFLSSQDSDLVYSDIAEHSKVRIVSKYRTPYDAFLRKMLKKIEVSQHVKYTCSSCDKTKMKRQAVGVWYCGSCVKTVASGAQNYKHNFCCHSKVCHQKMKDLKEH